MANVERVKKAITVMEQVKSRENNFDMTTWQSCVDPNNCHEAESTLHKCGTAACFAGWLAVSPEFQGDGGEVTISGMPLYCGDAGAYAIAKYLDINFDQAFDLCALTESLAEQFYGVSRSKITPQMVINKLQELIDHG